MRHHRIESSVFARVKILSIAGLLLAVTMHGFGQQWQYNALRNQAQKEAGLIGGEGGQWPQSLAVSSDASLLMMGTDVGGMIRSENGAERWEQANAGYTPRGSSGIAIDPNNSSRVISIGGNSRGSFGNTHGIYLSTDKGVTWKQVLEADICGYRDIREQLVWDASHFNTSIGGSSIAYWSRANKTWCQSGTPTVNPGIYKTTDGGETWEFILNSEDYGQSILKVHPTQGYVYAAGKSGFYKSTDGGITFRLEESGDITGLDVIASYPNRVYLSKSDGVYVSNDSGNTFDKISSSNYPTDAFFVKVSPANPDKMMVQYRVGSYDTPWYWSHDGGATWTETNMDNSLSFFPQNSGRRMYPVWHPTDQNVVWAVGGDWATKSTDGGETLKWSNNGSSLMTQSGYFSFNIQNPDIVTITNQDYNAAMTTNGGDTWKYMEVSGKGWGGRSYGSYALSEDVAFFRDKRHDGDKTHRVVITFDGGATFNRTNKEVTGKEVGYADPLNNDVLFLSSLRSTDRGETWNSMEGCEGVYTHNLTNPQEIFGINGSDVVRSTNGGDSWQTVFTTGDELRDMAYDHINDKFYAVSTDHLYEFVRATGTLTDITDRTPGDQIGWPNRYSTVAVDPVETAVVYVGNSRNIYATDVAVSRSEDGGQTWIPLTRSPRHDNVDSGINAGYEVRCIRVHPQTREAWVGGSCYGMWKIPAPGTDVAPDEINNVTVRAKGDVGSEQIEIRYNDQRVGDRITLSTSYQEYKVQVNNANGNFKVAFVNDNGSRDAEIDWLQVGTTRRQAETRSTNTAVWQNGSCGGSNSQRMNCNGYIDFGTMRSGAPIGQTVWLRSQHNDKFVSTNLNVDKVPLAAAWATSAQSWEQFVVVQAPGEYIALRSAANDKYVATENNRADKLLRANRSAIGSWEQYQWVNNSDGTISLKAQVNSKYVAVATNGDVRATSAGVTSEAKFSWGTISNARSTSGESKAATAELSAQSEVFRTYPNPATKQLTVAGGKDYQVTLYDLTGHRMMQHDHLSGKAELDIRHLRPGVYLLKLRDDQQHEVRQRIIIE